LCPPWSRAFDDPINLPGQSVAKGINSMSYQRADADNEQVTGKAVENASSTRELCDTETDSKARHG
jgi:hypothetical protein